MSNQTETITVSTKEALKKAQQNGTANIIITGELANKIHRSRKIGQLSKIKLAILTAAVGAATVSAPMSGGTSYAALVPVAALTGVEIAMIIFAVFMGIGLIIALSKDYDEIEFGKDRLVLRKKAK